MANLGSRLVYVIGVTDNPVKIGVAERLRARLSQLQIGCPEPLVIHGAVKVPYELAEKIEADAHRRFKAHHRRGEWFNIGHREALQFVRQAKTEYLVEHQFEARQGGDLIAQIGASHHLHRDVRGAVADYLERLDMRGGDKYIPHANGFILKRCGTVGYAAFSLVIAQQKTPQGLTAKQRVEMDGHLAKALNALSEFRRKYETTLREALFRAEFRALRDPRLVPPPPSLPPVRAV